MKDIYRDTHVVINLDHMADNIQAIKKLIGPKVAIAAVVKANGYGHGAVEVARVALEEGCKTIAVATLTEGIEIRKALPQAPVLIMGHTPDRHLELVAKYNLTQTVFTLSQAQALNSLGRAIDRKIAIQIKYDTGFNRLGFKDCDESLDHIERIGTMPYLSVEGFFSHLALKDKSSNDAQVTKFQQAIDKLAERGITFPMNHICDSISGVDDPDYRMDMIRPGALLYGLKSYKNPDFDLKQTMTFKTRISHLKEIKAGEGVSYDYLWQAKRDSLIATLPFGYADGYPRNMRDVGKVTIKGRQVPIIGVICMDQCMADVTDVPDVKAGDEVIIYGDGSNGTLDIQAISQMAATNKNEIVARITRRVPRVYVKNGQVWKIKDDLVED